MSESAVRVLHIEDDVIQRRMLVAQLKAVPDYSFVVTAAAGEDDAVAGFRDGFDLVILDYHLTQGDGVACVKRLRQLDAAIPIIAISGVATPEVAAELVEAGADDYFSKDGLDADVLRKCIGTALARSNAWRTRAASVNGATSTRVAQLAQRICETYAAFAGPQIVTMLADLEKTARSAHMSYDQTIRLFESVCERLAKDSMPPGQVKKMLRPMILEIVLRLFENSSDPYNRSAPHA